MAFTAEDVTDNARVICNDVDKSGWSEDEGLQFINEGVRYIYRECPDSRVLPNGKLREYAAVAAIGGTVGLDDIYMLPLTEYYLWRHFSGDAGDVRDNQRARDHQNNLMALLRPV